MPFLTPIYEEVFNRNWSQEPGTKKNLAKLQAFTNRSFGGGELNYSTKFQAPNSKKRLKMCRFECLKI